MVKKRCKKDVESAIFCASQVSKEDSDCTGLIALDLTFRSVRSNAELKLAA
jgi:hypothetical protein